MLVQRMHSNCSPAAGYPDPDPSAVLAYEVISLNSKVCSSQQEKLTDVCKQALHLLSRPNIQSSSRQPHVLLAFAAQKLSQLVPQLGSLGRTESCNEAVALLQLMTDYVRSAESSCVAAAAMQHCNYALQSILGVLLAAGVEVLQWTASSWRLIHRMVGFLACVCSKCRDAKTGRILLRTLLADQQTATMLMSAASFVLLQPEMLSSPAFSYRACSSMLQREILQFLIELAALIGRQPAALPNADVVATDTKAPFGSNSISSVMWEGIPSPGIQKPCAEYLVGECICLQYYNAIRF